MNLDICRVQISPDDPITMKCGQCGHAALAHIGTDRCPVCVLVAVGVVAETRVAALQGLAMRPAPLPAAGGQQSPQGAQRPPAADAVPTPPPPPKGTPQAAPKKHWWQRR